jgi:hypothetical protein
MEPLYKTQAINLTYQTLLTNPNLTNQNQQTKPTLENLKTQS